MARHIRPMWAIDEYATNLFRSSCLRAMSEAYIIPITARVDTVSPHAHSPLGTTGTAHRRSPNTPIFTITPLNTIVTAVGACSYVSGCHVWNGKIGILMANARKNIQNNHV